MKKLCLCFVCAALAVSAGGCFTDASSEVPPPAKKQVSRQTVRKSKNKNKKKKGIPDPVSDMLQIERKENKPFVSESDILNAREKKVFEDSWRNQHTESESLHRRVRDRHESDKKKRSDWVLF